MTTHSASTTEVPPLAAIRYAPGVAVDGLLQDVIEQLATEGLRLGDVTHSPEETLPTWCPDAGSLQPRRGAGPGSWFRQDSTVLQRLFGRPQLRNAADVVDEVMTMFPELERYWASGEVGPHMWQWRLNEPGTRKADDR